MAHEFAQQLESDFGLTTKPVVGKLFREINQCWLETFCPNLKRETGNWVYNDYRWHAYSFNHETATAGSRAFEEYQMMPMQPFYVFQESDDKLFDCCSTKWPDLRPLEDDVYVFPHTMEWTFITTHEMSIDLGPYFALAVDRNERQIAT